MLVIERQNEVPSWEPALPLSAQQTIRQCHSWFGESGNSINNVQGCLLLHPKDRSSSWESWWGQSSRHHREHAEVTQQCNASNGRGRDRNSQEMYENMHFLDDEYVRPSCHTFMYFLSICYVAVHEIPVNVFGSSFYCLSFQLELEAFFV